jgi:hypothetical protein
MSETSCAVRIYSLRIMYINYIYSISLIKRGDTLYQNNKCFAKPYRLSFLCIEGAKVNGERII